MPAVPPEERIQQLADELETDGFDLGDIVEALDAVKTIMAMRADEAEAEAATDLRLDTEP